MLRVPTCVAPSPVAGVGLFAATDLPARTVIWEYTEGVDWRITPDEFALFPEPYRSRLRHYVYQEDSGIFVLCGDNAKYMNHSDSPNCEDPEGEFTITLRPIMAGEELTSDYRTFDLESRLNGGPMFDADGSGNGLTPPTDRHEPLAQARERASGGRRSNQGRASSRRPATRKSRSSRP